MQPQHDVIVIGGGFSGIGAAILLDKAGFSDYLVLEEGDGVGGAWHWNTYPGVAVDIPSFSYQFSFERSSRWTRVYAPGEELKGYAEHCVQKYGLRDRIRLNSAVTGTSYDDATAQWTVSTSQGDTLTARYLVNATGVLTKPKPPAIPGLESFAGETVHTARWDHDLDLRGKRVGVIGTGASAVQLIPAIAEEVEQLTVFQRTAIWCLPKPDAALSPTTRAILGRVPGAQLLTRFASQTYVELTFPLAAHFHHPLHLASSGERLGRKALRDQVHDPAVRAKLTPQYAVGCKRPSFHNSYLSTFNRDDVHLETDPIAEITPTGVRTEAGAEYPIDVLVLATGFKVFERDNMPGFPCVSRDVDLGEWWAVNRAQAYEGVSVPGFPNMFSILGPYGYNGSSYFNLIETQMAHIVRCLTEAGKRGATAIEVKQEANDRYFASMLARRPRQVFTEESCSVANSYYFDEHGDTPFRASPTLETMWRAGHFPFEDYDFAS
ncbi:NAD(P)/FAD-dependent oxidoreductase [Nocardioides marmoriginsengisoli]|uniref:NAD(P)/FAD-dependent oxidoreductase n=1 Tax=Nocardioides marmoriginsengisoli TaxID=661483 RepID=A0A3N0CAB8_9ACTN|nr:NAD(P)/FAD-dependent oxidoreductase [Nocardioides marmoriginsengisoli]RNL60408.1 NAD(P)/FAD-dependent oxidoreductase [Nocardioides marmoriginsengisoli]